MRYNINLILFFLITNNLFAQHDTTYYTEYNDKLIISLHNSFSRKYDISFNQNIMKDSISSVKAPIHYLAEGDVVSGFEIDYDMFGISFDYKAVPPDNEAKKGKTTFTDIGLNVGGSKWRLETGYKMYEGFYDANTKNYTKPFNDTTSPFYQNPNMSTKCTKAKFIYLTKPQKFSYDAAYSCGARQIKSALSWILVCNLYYNKLSTDTSFVPFPIRKYYYDFSDFNGLNVLGLSVGGGFSANLVSKRGLLLNITMALEPESQWRKYHFASGFSTRRNYLAMSGDLRASFGYNAKRFFCSVSSIGDYTNYNSGQLNISNSFISGEFTIGWRFKVKKPEFYKKFEETKIYKML